MLEITAVCRQCGARLILDMPDFWASPSGIGLARREDLPEQEVKASVRHALESRPCPSCGGWLRVASADGGRAREVPAFRKNPHTIQLVRHARTLLAASGVRARLEPAEVPLWQELMRTLEQAELRLTWPHSKRGRKLLLTGAVCRAIEDLADYFQVTRQEVVRQLLRQTPREAFPLAWVTAAMGRKALSCPPERS